MFKETLRQVWCEIDMGAFDHNIKQIRAHLGDDTPIVGVIKANGYGHGATECAKVLAYNGVNHFAVATVEEAINLVEDGIEGKIVILGLTAPEFQETIVEYGFIPVIGDYEVAVALNDAVAAAKAAGTKPADYEQKCWFAIDTGMGRIGYRVFDDAEVAYATEEYKKYAALPEINPAGIFTHFSSADEESTAYTEMQMGNYDSFIASLNAAGFFPKQIMSNSAATMVYPAAKHDAVRCGIIMYGQAPSGYLKGKVLDLKPVMEVKAEILNLKTVPAGTSVSYGRKFTSTEAETKIATIGLGYADGYSRLNSGKINVLCGGVVCPVIGNICMDQCMVDVSAVPDVKRGDEIVVMGKQGDKEISADDLAAINGTINYEITCAFDIRLPKVYMNYPEGMCK